MANTKITIGNKEVDFDTEFEAYGWLKQYTLWLKNHKDSEEA